MLLKMLSSLLVLVSIVTLSICQDPQARLLVSKKIHNIFLVEGQDIVAEYTIYNIGDSAALSIHLTDDSFNAKDFDVVRGLLKFKVDRLGPGANISHTVVVRPKISGYLNFTAAEVRYRASEEANQDQIGYSSEPGEGGIVAFKDFDRKFSPHFLDWTAFLIMTLPSLGIPFILWFKSKSRYETIAKRIKKH